MLHHRIILYNNSGNSQRRKREKSMVHTDFSEKKFPNVTQESSIKTQGLENSTPSGLLYNNSKLHRNYGPNYNPASLFQDSLITGNDHFSDENVTSTGSFLDSFKDDPKFKTIYFTSKDLMFSYKKTVSNVMNLGFDMDANDYNQMIKSSPEINNRYQKSIAENETTKIAPGSGLIFQHISESFKTILFMLLTLVMALYLSFRYILNKYI